MDYTSLTPGLLGLSESPTQLDTSWTDDLPICTETGVGCSPNQIYRRDGQKTSEHEVEDFSFHFRSGDHTYLYGVFDGHRGCRAAKFAVQRMPAEILLEQLSPSSTDDEIQDVLCQAFLSVEREFFSDIIGETIAKRTGLLSNVPEGENPYDYLCRIGSQEQFEILNREVATGTTAVVVLIFHGKLYVANVGDSRALLCRTDSDGVLRVSQISVEHDLNNVDERLRVNRLGLSTEVLQETVQIVNQTNTRCLGNYLVKGGYREMDVSYNTQSDPVIPDPDVHVEQLDDSCRFLILLSDGLFRALREASEGPYTISELAQMIVEEFKTQSTMVGVAQAVIDRVARMHYDAYASNMKPMLNKRDDMTLLVRNFNFPLPKSISSPTSGRNRVYTDSSSVSTNGNSTPMNTGFPMIPPARMFNQDPGFDTATNTTSTESSERTQSSQNKLPLNEHGLLEPYVNFSDYFNLDADTKKLLDDILL